MAFTETPRAFFGDFGVDATLNAGTVRGIFENAYGSSFGGMVDSGGPTFLSESSASVGDVLVIAGDSYTVASVEPDGTGFVLLRLKK